MTSRSDHRPAAEVHPSLDGRIGLSLEALDAEAIGQRADVAFCCLPHVASMSTVPRLLDAGLKVIDLSADYRLSDPAVYEHWYGHVHTDPTRLGSTVYGLPEINRDRIIGQDLVANPGCYTSTTILALAPLLDAGLIEPGGIIVDAKSGVSGAGRSPSVTTLFAECNESISAYKVGSHRHQPEIEQVLAARCAESLAGRGVDVIFTPHLVPMDRGILATIYARPAADVTQDRLLTAMRAFYEGEPFITVTEQLPATKHVSGTNVCRMTARVVKDRVIVLSTLDNMIKGASGVAVQNFNLICGYAETDGLLA